MGAGWGEGAEAVVWGRGKRVPAPTAAFLNGFQAHCQEYDCVHEKAVLHPMATLLPAAIAYAERKGGISGRELIVAVAVGVDVAANLGVAAREGLKFFRPATAGGFGATAAIGRLAGFDADTLCNAFGIQYGQTSGTMQSHVEGSIVLPMQIGFNGRAALHACDIAATGLSGPRDVFEGPVRIHAAVRGHVGSSADVGQPRQAGESANSATSRIRRAARRMAASKASWRCVSSTAFKARCRSSLTSSVRR